MTRPIDKDAWHDSLEQLWDVPVQWTWSYYGVAVTLLGFANNDGECFAKKSTLAVAAHVSVATVERALPILRSVGLLKWDTPKVFKGTDHPVQPANRYRLVNATVKKMVRKPTINLTVQEVYNTAWDHQNDGPLDGGPMSSATMSPPEGRQADCPPRLLSIDPSAEDSHRETSATDDPTARQTSESTRLSPGAPGWRPAATTAEALARVRPPNAAQASVLAELPYALAEHARLAWERCVCDACREVRAAA